MGRGGQDCPCGSGRTLASCCGPLLAGKGTAITAEQLMRSRYTANVLNDFSYVHQTWHIETRPRDIAEISGIRWRGLEISEVSGGGPGDNLGTVTFSARLFHDGHIVTIQEKSTFVKEEGRWYYINGLSGENSYDAGSKAGRNDPCPCGSGKKYKKCCRL